MQDNKLTHLIEIKRVDNRFAPKNTEIRIEYLPDAKLEDILETVTKAYEYAAKTNK